MSLWTAAFESEFGGFAFLLYLWHAFLCPSSPAKWATVLYFRSSPVIGVLFSLVVIMPCGLSSLLFKAGTRRHRQESLAPPSFDFIY